MLRIRDIVAQVPVHIILRAKTPLFYDGDAWVVKTFKAGPKQKQNVVTNIIGTVTANDLQSKTLSVMVSSGLSLDRFWTHSGAPLSARLNCLYLNLQIVHKSTFRRWNHYKFQRAGIRLPDRKVARPMLVPAGAGPKQTLLISLASLPGGVNEIIFHPGLPEIDKTGKSDFAKVREVDTKLLTDPDVVEANLLAEIEKLSKITVRFAREPDNERCPYGDPRNSHAELLYQ